MCAQPSEFEAFCPIDDVERAARFALWRVRGVGSRRMARLLEVTEGQLAQLFEADAASAGRLLQRCGLGEGVGERVRQVLADPAAGELLAREVDALPASTRIRHVGEPDYPARLLDLPDPPVFVYVRGDASWLSSRATVAVVGSRKASVADVRLAHTLAAELAAAGCAVISGGALGVDAAAHRGCLDAGAPTIAVLAGGVERPTPRRNAAVFEQVVGQGAIVTEYPLGVRPRRFHFQRRNELIAALGDATVVVRAGEKSGTMLTARAAARLGRPLCAVPGALDSPLTQGCHKLLVDGAQCVRHARDVLERVLNRPRTGEQLVLDVSPAAPVSETPPRAAPSSPRPAPSSPRPAVCLDTLSADARTLYEALGILVAETDEGVGRDPLARHLQWDAGRLSSALLELELAGAVSKRPGADAFVRR